MPVTRSPLRHALSEKSTNNRLNIKSPHGADKSAALSQRTAGSTLSLPGSRPLPASSPRAGQKRRRGLFEESPILASQHSVLSAIEDDDMSLGRLTASIPTMTASASTMATSQTSFSASQKEEVPLEETFEIQEEMSQRALNELHTVALSQGLAASQTLLPVARPSLLKDASLDSVGMSKYVDFDRDASSSSQKSLIPSDGADDGMTMIEVKITTTTKDRAVAGGVMSSSRIQQSATRSRENSTIPARKTIMDQKAATLRTRLQLAIYKVETNQISKPFSRLAQPQRSISPANGLVSPDLPQDPSMSSLEASMVPDDHSAETHISLARGRATMQPKPAVQSLYSLPVPSIVPTQFSARYNTVPPNLDPEYVTEIPSSPPISHSSQDEQQTQQLKTPHRTMGDGIELEAGVISGNRAQNGMVGYDGLTSSVVKGEAADSLLRLMRAGSAVQ